MSLQHLQQQPVSPSDNCLPIFRSIRSPLFPLPDSSRRRPIRSDTSREGRGGRGGRCLQALASARCVGLGSSAHHRTCLQR